MAAKLEQVEGIEVRHARACATNVDGGDCDCKPSYRVRIWSNRERKRLRKTFTDLPAAKRWRQDAIVGLRRGEITAARGPTLNVALDRWLDALGKEHTRSGLPYKPGTIRDYRRTIRRYGVRETLGHLRVRDVRTQDAQR